LKDGYCHDLALVCRGEERLELHRVILAARSVVFRTMVDVDMVERKTLTIKIEDFEASVVKEFIHFLYADQISDNFTNFAELMRIGHQYQVFSLVDKCAEHLVDDVSVDNVAQLGRLAEAFEAVVLSEKCAIFVAENFKNIDKDILDSIPSPLYRKSFETYTSNMKKTAVVNFFTSLGDPIVVKENSSISTHFSAEKWFRIRSGSGSFSANSDTSIKMTGVGLYISKETIPIELSLSRLIVGALHAPAPLSLVTMSTSITSSDSSKPLKIFFPAPVNMDFGSNYRYRYQLVIKIGKECINFKGDLTKPSVSIPIKNGELKVNTSGDRIQVPVLYFEY